MWLRQEVKVFGKQRFKMNYWWCVLAAFIMALVSGAGGGSIRASSSHQADGQSASGMGSVDPAAATALSVEVVIALIIALAITFLLLYPVKVGCQKFFFTNLIGHGYWRSRICF